MAPTVHHKPVNEVDNQPTKTTKSAMFGGIPFEAFAGGGMPGGSGMGGPPKDVDTTKLYETLEIEKSADPKDVKKRIGDSLAFTIPTREATNTSSKKLTPRVSDCLCDCLWVG